MKNKLFFATMVFAFVLVIFHDSGDNLIPGGDSFGSPRAGGNFVANNKGLSIKTVDGLVVTMAPNAPSVGVVDN